MNPSQLSIVNRALSKVLVLASLLLFDTSIAEVAFSGDLTTPIRISIKKEALCTSNLVKLADVADLSGSSSMIQSLQDLPLAPTPAEGKTQRWTKADIQNHLKLRGHQPDSFRWTGSETCEVKRVKKSPRTRDDFVATTANPANHSQAQRNVERAILSYLQLQTQSTTQWKVKAEIPGEHAKSLYQNRTIQGVAGGTEPWEGRQYFTLLLKTPQGEEEIEIEANVEAPPMVVAAAGPMRQGQVIGERDVKYLPLTSSARLPIEDCYLQANELIGKELRKAVSTGQVFAKQEIGPPRVINTGDLIEIEVIAGSVSVQTSGKSLGPGGIGDTIQVEVIPHKKRIMAHIVGERKVQASLNVVR